MALLAASISAGFGPWVLLPVRVAGRRLAAVGAVQIETIGQQADDQNQNLKH